MEDTAHRAIAIVGVGAVLPDAPNAAAFWNNVKEGRYSITDVESERWDPALYYDADPTAPDKAYSKIGGWVREHVWDPIKWRLPVPPRVADAMDDAQKWAVSCTREALEDYGYPSRPLNTDRTAVILGNAMAGEKHYLTSLRLYLPEFARELSAVSSFAELPELLRREIAEAVQSRMKKLLPEVTEDTMPGELANCMAGRVANLFNFRGPNFVTDAACASAMAAISAAVEGLVENEFDVAVTGGVDRNMGAATFIKFCKIGALSATGTRPYADGADGFVMGEGAAIFIMKRLADAEKNKDNIYAVLRGIGGSSDGRGKGITAPNPVGQKLCLERAWHNAGLSPASVTYVEGHGTSTRVGDRVEAQTLVDVLSSYNLPQSSIALGSVKSNIGHLKGAAGAAGILKTTFALRDKVLPPSVHCERPNPDIDFAHSPLYVNTELREWTHTEDGVRRAGVSAFGFGGTNFHAVLEEYVPGRLSTNGKHTIAVRTPEHQSPQAQPPASGTKPPLRGALVAGAQSKEALVQRLRGVLADAVAGHAPAPQPPDKADLTAQERIAIDYADAADLAAKCEKALKALGMEQPAMWKALRAQGVFRGRGAAPKVAFLYTGQGSQYLNMLRSLRESEPIVRDTFAEADHVMTPILGKPLSEYIYVDTADPSIRVKAEADLRQTAITQPAVLATDMAMTRLMAAYGIEPDMTMGHSLGEYGALVASRALPFEDALEAVAARGREMTRVSFGDKGKMAAVFAPFAEIERILAGIDGYVVVANINSNTQAVIGGASHAVESAVDAFLKAGFNAVPLEVSHAFHTSIVAPASEPLVEVLQRLRLSPPAIPTIANVSGDFYPSDPGAVPRIIEILGKQIAAPVQFVKGLRSLYEAGARVFVETGPKKALHGFAEDIFGDKPDVVALFTNHPKFDDATAFNQALCGLYAAGLGKGRESSAEVKTQPALTAEPPRPIEPAVPAPVQAAVTASSEKYAALGHLLANFLDRSWELYRAGSSAPESSRSAAPVTITGAALGLPGTDRIFDEANIARILRGEQFIGSIPAPFRQAILDKHITRLVKSDNGGPVFELIRNPEDVLKLAGRGGAFDPQNEFGLSPERLAALDRATMLAIAVGIDALRDAGIPLVMHYKTTSKGSRLPERWGLPDALRDDTGVIFASCWPGADSLVREVSSYHQDRARREQLQAFEDLRASVNGSAAAELDRRIAHLRKTIEEEAFTFDRRFLFRILPMGHSQFAELIGARGPNTQINSACASTTQAVALAEDWIHQGRCRRVIIVAADDVTSDNLMEWVGSGFLATGAAATDENVRDAALPFDRRRHGTILGMGAAGLVVETAEAARERGLLPICEVLGTASANSAFHGTRLDVQHICQIMESLVAGAEQRSGISRAEMAQKMVFVSHETFTPARGGSAAAEIYALRSVFRDGADKIIIANTKGFTGHAMGAGIEDVVAVKALETGCVPPVANFREADPELGNLNLSKGGNYPVEFALRLGAGFGSQISMTLMRWVSTGASVRPRPENLGYQKRIRDANVWSSWMRQISGSPAPELEVVKHTLRVRDGQAAEPAPVQAELAQPAETEAQPALSAAPAEARDPVRERVLALVAAKTGYPADMLALDLDLEADLGVDTVKQAEVFASVREAWNIPRDENLRLRDFPTLAHVIRFVYDKRPDLATAPPQPEPAPASSTDQVKEQVLALVCEKTGYPKDMLALDLDLEADLGVDTVKQAELFASIRSVYNIPRDENLKLRDFPTLAHVIQFVKDRRPDLAAPPAPVAVATAAIPAAAPAQPAPAAPAALRLDEVAEQVLDLVCAKTGYPKDMLDLDLDLEADLGVDTVKQAELFAAVRAIYDIPRDENLKLRDFPTLAHVIQFVRDRRPDKVAATAEPLQGAPPVAPAGDLITETVLDIVARQTGYPKEMLDLDLDLEADLGIDTVKQAEMFASVRSAFNIPRDENLKLRDFPTLAHVIGFARDRQHSADEASSVQEQPSSMHITEVSAAARVPRRVPVPAPRPPISMCKQTGVNPGPGVRVLIRPDKGGVADALVSSLQGRGVEAIVLHGDVTAETLASAGPVQGVYWLPALDDEGSLAQMTPPIWRDALNARVKDLYETMRSLYGAFLVSAVRLGGYHGYGPDGASAPLGGAVTGFAKTYKRERPEALVKAVDFESSADPASIALRLLDETEYDPGAVEVGYAQEQRWTTVLKEEPATDGAPGMVLDRNSVFVVTGAAGSIVSAITADLATASGGTFYLLDLVAHPDPTNRDLVRFANDKDALKRDIAARIAARGERATPALVEKELAALERTKAALEAIQAVKAAGGTAQYFSLDMRDADAVRSAIDAVRQASGRIDVLLHAAGLERSRMLPDKPAPEFDLVFDVKADGWFNLLNAIGDMPLGAAVAFSSIAGRFGNAGQADYSAANDLLCKIVSSFRTTRPQTRGIAIDWTAWGGIGMATRGSIPKMMELAGIDMLPPEVGIPFIRRELTAGGARGEVVVADRLGILMQEWDERGGAGTVPAAHMPMLGNIAAAGLHAGLTVVTTLDPKDQPFLNDHRIGGTPVLPGVMGIEAFAEAAASTVPGWNVATIEDVEFLAPFKFYRDQPRTVTVNVLSYMKDAEVLSECRLTGVRSVAGQAEAQTTTHFVGRVRLRNSSRAPEYAEVPRPGEPLADCAGIYRLYFHGPAYQVLDRVWQDGERMVGLMNDRLPANHHPADQPTLAAPRLIELCFQTAGIMEMIDSGRMGLPRHIDCLTVCRVPEPAEQPLMAVVTRGGTPESFDADVIDDSGRLYIRLKGYRTVALEETVDTTHLRVLHAVAH